MPPITAYFFFLSCMVENGEKSLHRSANAPNRGDVLRRELSGRSAAGGGVIFLFEGTGRS